MKLFKPRILINVITDFVMVNSNLPFCKPNQSNMIDFLEKKVRS